MLTAKILCIDTAVIGCSVALFEGHKLLYCCESLEKNIAAEALNEYLDTVLKESSCHFSQLDAVAISGGPGSYTGLRIGAATAKGLCYALKIPLIHIDTTAIIAASVAGENTENIISLIDARRNDVFYAVYSKNIEEKEPIGFMTLSEDFFTKYDVSNSIIVGDGAHKAQQYTTINCDSSVTPSAKNMGAMAFKKFENKAYEDIAYYEPRYHKAFYTTMQIQHR